jgi:hypothetical protein
MKNEFLYYLWCVTIALIIGAFISYGPNSQSSQLQSSEEPCELKVVFDEIDGLEIVEIQIGTNTTKLGRDFVKTDTFNATGNHSYLMNQDNYFCWDYDCNCYTYENSTGWLISTCQ